MPPLSSHWGLDDRIVAEAIESGPTFVRTRLSTRWHRIRSGVRWLAAYDPDNIRESYMAWCGPAIGTTRSGPPIFTDAPPAKEPLCGTCEGRAIGADPEHPEWLFMPRGATPPKLCPGSQTMWVREDQGHRARGTCLVCQDVVKLRGFGGAYNWNYGIQRHAPGPGLVAPCELHGWRHLLRMGDLITCRCEVTR